MNASLNQYKFEDFVELEDDFSGNRLPGIPNHTISLGSSVQSPLGLRLNLNFRSVGEMFLRDENEEKVDAYQLLNLKLGYEKQFGAIGFGIQGGMNNVLDTKYSSMILVNANSFGGAPPRYFYPGLPRNYYLNVKVNVTLSRS